MPVDALPLSTVIDDALDGDAAHALHRWACSGAMHLTGATDGPPLAGPARVAPAMDALAAIVQQITARMGTAVDVDGAALLGERAAIAGFGRQGASSCGGGSRLLRAADEWLALSLARDTDVELLEAWLCEPCNIRPCTPLTTDAWASVAAIVHRHPAGSLVERATLLGLPCARPGETTALTPLVATASMDRADRPPRALRNLTVVDLSSLWAGPLCANLLGLAGAHVIKVESATRPDGARSGPSGFFDLLHAGHRSVALDLTSDDGRRWLRRLLATADVVIEASRPRALDALGASFEHMHAQGWRGVWLSITGHGRDGPNGERVGFGDDAAVAGGLVAEHARAPLFCADAVADPMTGLLGAAAVLTALEAGETGLLSVSLARTAAHMAAGARRHPPIDTADATDLEVGVPHARRPAGPAARLGAHTDAVLAVL